MSEVPESIKIRLINESLADFSGTEALALLSDSHVPESCRHHALKQSRFLDRVSRGEILDLLRQPLVAAEQKKATLDRVADSLTEDDILVILRHADMKQRSSCNFWPIRPLPPVFLRRAFSPSSRGLTIAPERPLTEDSRSRPAVTTPL